MNHPQNINQVIKNRLCMGCGLCSIDKASRKMAYSKEKDCQVADCTEVDGNSIANTICPGKGYAIKDEAEKLFVAEAQYQLPLGYVHSLYATHSTSNEVLTNASSGGIITQMLLYLIEKKIVDYVSVTQFVCDKEGVHTRTFLTDKKGDILKAQGSKYCPVCLDQLLEELHTREGRVAVMATPIRAIEREQPDYLKANIVLHISNFCGGFKSFRNIKRLAKIHHVDYYNLKDFRFRGDGQPGSLRFIENTGKEASTPYPLYVGLYGRKKRENKLIERYSKEIATRRKLKICQVSYGAPKNMLKMADLKYCYATPEIFLSLMLNASFVIVSSFHGTAFSVNFNKQFLTVSPENFNSRIDSLLGILGLQNRIICNESYNIDNLIDIDYNDVNSKLRNERKTSIEFLKQVLHKDF